VTSIDTVLSPSSTSSSQQPITRASSQLPVSVVPSTSAIVPFA